MGTVGGMRFFAVSLVVVVRVRVVVAIAVRPEIAVHRQTCFAVAEHNPSN